MGMSETVKSIQARARELAISGKFAGWRALAFELQFEPGFFDAYGWLYSPSTKEELDGLCKEAITTYVAKKVAGTASAAKALFNVSNVVAAPQSVVGTPDAQFRRAW